MKKILVVRYRFIGDTVLTVPFLRNLRRANPDARIDMLVGPVSGELLEDCPYIDNLIYFDTTNKHRYENTAEEKKSFFSYVKLLKETNYDKAYVLKRSLSSALLVFLAGIKERIGFNTEMRGCLLTKKVPYVKDKHEVECFLDVLKADGIKVTDNHLESWVNPRHLVKINEIIRKNNIIDKPKVMIHATSGNVNKQWPLEYFADVVKYLVKEKGVQLFYVGTENDAFTYYQIHDLIGENLTIEPINLCGQLSLQESAALIKRMDLMIGCDSGNLHIAASSNIPVVGIYGPMNPKKWYAWGDLHSCLVDSLSCIPCELKKKCQNNHACLTNITAEMVIKAVGEKLDKIVQYYV